jgi:dienelactone hydrolase
MLRIGFLLLSIALALVCGCETEAPAQRADGGRDTGARDASETIPDASVDDAAVDDAPALDAWAGSRCTVTPTTVLCTHETHVLPTGAGLPDRDVHFQIPLGEAPAAGFPVALVFQGATLSAERAWSGDAADLTDTFGMIHQARLVARLLDAGYAVITPEAAGDGSTFYDTNIPPYATMWETAPDHQLMLGIFAGIEAGDFGPLDASALFAVGFSSGGYMTSRMAVSYPGRFRALAINSGSYATCAGAACIVPSTLPADHPPTLFLHGELDAVVPIATMLPYESALRGEGVITRIVRDSTAAHQWLEAAPDEVVAWFAASR